MTSGPHPKPALYNLYRGVMLIALLFALAAVYIRYTRGQPAEWGDLPTTVIFGLYGMSFLLFPDREPSRTPRYGTAALFMTVAALMLLTFIRHVKG
jgi:hypothetical protein